MSDVTSDHLLVAPRGGHSRPYEIAFRVSWEIAGARPIAACGRWLGDEVLITSGIGLSSAEYIAHRAGNAGSGSSAGEVIQRRRTATLSLDPDRDTPEAIHRLIHAKMPWFTALLSLNEASDFAERFTGGGDNKGRVALYRASRGFWADPNEAVRFLFADGSPQISAVEYLDDNIEVIAKPLRATDHKSVLSHMPNFGDWA